jgi:hypothetical protein
MKIAEKYISVNKNINEVKSDLLKLTRDSKNPDYDSIKIFYGKLSGDTFVFLDEDHRGGRWESPELHGKLFSSGENTTQIKIDITISAFNIAGLFVMLCVQLYFFVTYLPTWDWQEKGFLNLVVFIPIIIILITCLWLRNPVKSVLNEFDLYREGYYDQYLT